MVTERIRTKAGPYADLIFPGCVIKMSDRSTTLQLVLIVPPSVQARLKLPPSALSGRDNHARVESWYELQSREASSLAPSISPPSSFLLLFILVRNYHVFPRECRLLVASRNTWVVADGKRERDRCASWNWGWKDWKLREIHHRSYILRRLGCSANFAQHSIFGGRNKKMEAGHVPEKQAALYL